jgi:hypothetical protein
MNLSDFAKRADEVIGLADKTIQSARASQYGVKFCDDEMFATFRSAGLSFLVTTSGDERTYYNEFDKQTREIGESNARAGRGVLVAARDEVSGGWATTVRGIVSAEVFADYMTMAEHLLEEKYKDAAAVIIGSTLEEHLRQLAVKHGIQTDITDANGKTTPKKADQLNADLKGAGVYNALVHKGVTTWLDLRNKAAHGKYKEYTEQDVDLLHKGVSNFMTQFAG